MHVFVLTGGIAMGKSTFCEMARKKGSKVAIFDCDTYVHELLTKEEIKEKIEQEFGSSLLCPDKTIHRDRLREIIFSDSKKRQLLEKILHPKVIEECRKRKEEALTNSQIKVFIADIPLYYEMEEKFDCDKVIVVASKRETQLERLANVRGLSSQMAEKIIDEQLPIDKKIALADVFFWNEGPKKVFEEQISQYLNHIMPEIEQSVDVETSQVSKPDVPEKIDLNAFHEKGVAELYQLGEEQGLRVGGTRSKHKLIFEILNFYGRQGTAITAEGVLEFSSESYGFIRWPRCNFNPSPDDVYISPSFVRKYNLRTGNRVKVRVRSPREKENFLSTEAVLSVEDIPIEEYEAPAPFDKLTALFPSERIILENKEVASATPRVIDLIAPLGKGQRGLIVAPPRGGKTIMLKDTARSIVENHEEIELIILLLDERPEEVTDFKESIPAPVYSSTFDESPQCHVQVAEIVLERAKRLVELGKDVVILLDSITRLARGYNALQSGKGRIMSGGVESKALIKPKKFFGAARNVEEGGSLTIVATALTETESRMDEVIFEEFKGTGNMELHLDRELLEKRIFPAIHIAKSGTRKDDLLYHPDEMKKVTTVRKQLAQLPAGEAMEVLIRNIHKTTSNAELLLKGIEV